MICLYLYIYIDYLCIENLYIINSLNSIEYILVNRPHTHTHRSALIVDVR